MKLTPKQFHDPILKMAMDNQLDGLVCIAVKNGKISKVTLTPRNKESLVALADEVEIDLGDLASELDDNFGGQGYE